MPDRDDVHVRRREADRVAAAARRQAARESGQPVGHALDALVVDAVALVLAGRPADDPVRALIMRELSRVCWARQVEGTPVLGRRLHARLSIGKSLRDALMSRRVEAEVDGIGR